MGQAMDVCANRRLSIDLDGPWTDEDDRDRVRVLIVTPDGDLRAVIRRVLERSGCAVADAAHSGHALLACMTNRRIDVVIAESVLEDISGPELAAKLRRHQPALRAAFFADAGTPPGPDQLTRPFTADVLIDAIEALTSLAAS